jgi:uncharacterized membrane protein YadS
MSLGSLCLIASAVFFFLIGIGVHLVPGIDAFSHMLLALGILLSGFPLPWWRGP